MNRKLHRRPIAAIVLTIALAALVVLVARYGVALNPFDGCAFPEGRTSPHQDCHAVGWIWNE